METGSAIAFSSRRPHDHGTARGGDPKLSGGIGTTTPARRMTMQICGVRAAMLFERPCSRSAPRQVGMRLARRTDWWTSPEAAPQQEAGTSKIKMDSNGDKTAAAALRSTRQRPVGSLPGRDQQRRPTLPNTWTTSAKVSESDRQIMRYWSLLNPTATIIPWRNTNSPPAPDSTS